MIKNILFVCIIGFMSITDGRRLRDMRIGITKFVEEKWQRFKQRNAKRPNYIAEHKKTPTAMKQFIEQLKKEITQKEEEKSAKLQSIQAHGYEELAQIIEKYHGEDGELTMLEERLQRITDGERWIKNEKVDAQE